MKEGFRATNCGRDYLERDGGLCHCQNFEYQVSSIFVLTGLGGLFSEGVPGML